MDLKIQKKFQTEKGKPCILVDGYKYREFNVLKKCGSIRYRCTNKNCSASLLVNNDVTVVISMLNDHNHNVIADNIVGRQIINSRIKRKCENDLLTRPNKIIRAELQNSENDIELVNSDLRLWRKSMYDFRRKSMPKIPKSSVMGVWLKKFFALGFLPANLVENAFLHLIENAPTSDFGFSDYIYLKTM